MATVVTFTGFTSPLPDPGPYVPPVPRNKNPKRSQFIRAFKFGNVPGGKSENAKGTGEAGAAVFHVNTAMSVLSNPSDKSSRSGVVKFRFGGAPSTPSSVLATERRNTDRFGNPILPVS